MKQLCTTLLIAAMAILTNANAQTAENFAPIHVSFLDVAHSSISNQVYNFSNTLDSFVGGTSKISKRSHSQIYLKLITESKHGESPLVYHALSAKIDLPKTKDKLKLIVSSSFSEQNQAPKTELENTNSDEENLDMNDEPGIFSTAMQYMVNLNQNWNMDYRAGVDLDGINLHPFTRLYARHNIKLGNWNERFIEQVYLHEIKGLGQQTKLDLERKLFKQSVFRLSSTADWTEKSKQFELSQSANLSYKMLRNIYLQHSFSAIGHYDQAASLDRYVISTQLRFKLLRKWSYFKLSPVINLPRAKQFKPEYSVRASVELAFGK